MYRQLLQGVMYKVVVARSGSVVVVGVVVGLVE